MKILFLLFPLIFSCSHSVNYKYRVLIDNDVGMFSRSGECQLSFVEDITKIKYQVIYFCGPEGNIILTVEKVEK